MSKLLFIFTLFTTLWASDITQDDFQTTHSRNSTFEKWGAEDGWGYLELQTLQNPANYFFKYYGLGGYVDDYIQDDPRPQFFKESFELDWYKEFDNVQIRTMKTITKGSSTSNGGIFDLMTKNSLSIDKESIVGTGKIHVADPTIDKDSFTLHLSENSAPKQMELDDSTQALYEYSQTILNEFRVADHIQAEIYKPIFEDGKLVAMDAIAGEIDADTIIDPFTFHVQYSYDNNTLVSEKEFILRDTGLELSGDKSYFYDGNNLVGFSYYDIWNGDKELLDSILYTYDINGLLQSSKKVRGTSETKTTCARNSAGKITELITEKRNNGELTSADTLKFTYTTEGHMATYSHGDTLWSTTYENNLPTRIDLSIRDTLYNVFDITINQTSPVLVSKHSESKAKLSFHNQRLTLLEDVKGHAFVSLFNSRGQVVFQQRKSVTGLFHCDLSQTTLAKGTYLAHVQIENKTYTLKIQM